MGDKKELTGYPSIDKPWLKYYSDEAINAPIPECSIYEYLWESNKDYPKDIAINYCGRKISYGELFKNIDKTAAAFLALDVEPGEIVTVALPSIPEALYVVYALNKIGAVANMIHPMAGEQEILHYLNEVESRMAVIFDGTYKTIKDKINQTHINQTIVVSAGESLPLGIKQLFCLKNRKTRILQGGTFYYWGGFLKKGVGQEIKKIKKDPTTMAIISHTGGTTGEPKGVMCSDINANALMHQIVCNFEYNRQGTSLAVLPPFINYSLIEAMMAMLAIGYKVVLIPDYKPLAFGKYVKEYRPNIILSIPAYWEAMLKIKNITDADMSCFEQIYAGGEVMSRENEKAVNSILASGGAKTTLMKGLGSTEMTGGATQTYESCNVEGSVGIPLVKLTCRIVDSENRELSYNEEGEICFAGPTVMMGYYKNPKATSEIVKTDINGTRWLHTGDLGYLDENGVLFVTGRIKRILMTKGKDGNITKLFPDRIEKTINSHPGVKLCCVVGIPNEQRIHYPKAYVEVNEGFIASEELAEGIRKYCEDKLPDYQIPDAIEFSEKLPRTERGKVDYRVLERISD